MLQQTQVQTVVPYYQRFMQQFPSLVELASAPLDHVLALWSGLGYYARARNLHRAAGICVREHAGGLPENFDAIAALPGIGRSTAGAILAQAHGQRHPILDGNVRRVLARYRAVSGDPGITKTQLELWALSQAALPDERLCDYTQALMDLGATLCTRSQPACTRCPLRDDCQALAQGRVGEFPQPRTRRVRPLRQSCQLWVHDAQQRVLLCRRPPIGIWAGLWSLIDGDSQAEALARLSQVGIAIESAAPMAKIRHEFTHFSLDIEVQSAQARTVGIADSDLRWIYPSDALQLGIPQPLRRLILENPQLSIP